MTFSELTYGRSSQNTEISPAQVSQTSWRVFMARKSTAMVLGPVPEGCRHFCPGHRACGCTQLCCRPQEVSQMGVVVCRSSPHCCLCSLPCVMLLSAERKERGRIASLPFLPRWQHWNTRCRTACSPGRASFSHENSGGV